MKIVPKGVFFCAFRCRKHKTSGFFAWDPLWRVSDHIHRVFWRDGFVSCGAHARIIGVVALYCSRARTRAVIARARAHHLTRARAGGGLQQDKPPIHVSVFRNRSEGSQGPRRHRPPPPPRARARRAGGLRYEPQTIVPCFYCF